MESGISANLSKFIAVNGLIRNNAALDSQGMHCPIYCNFILVVGFQFNTIFDPLGSFNIRVSKFHTENSILCLSNSLVL